MFQINLFFSFFPKLWRHPNKNPQLLQQSKPTKLDILLLSFENLQKMKMTYQRLREAAASEILDFCSSAALSLFSFFSAPLPPKEKNAAARVPFFQIFPPQISRSFPSSLSLPISPTPLKKIIFFSSLSSQPGGLQSCFHFSLKNNYINMRNN